MCPWMLFRACFVEMWLFFQYNPAKIFYDIFYVKNQSWGYVGDNRGFLELSGKGGRATKRWWVFFLVDVELFLMGVMIKEVLLLK